MLLLLVFPLIRHLLCFHWLRVASHTIQLPKNKKTTNFVSHLARCCFGLCANREFFFIVVNRDHSTLVVDRARVPKQERKTVFYRNVSDVNERCNACMYVRAMRMRIGKNSRYLTVNITEKNIYEYLFCSFVRLVPSYFGYCYCCWLLALFFSCFVVHTVVVWWCDVRIFWWRWQQNFRQAQNCLNDATRWIPCFVISVCCEMGGRRDTRMCVVLCVFDVHVWIISFSSAFAMIAYYREIVRAFFIVALMDVRNQLDGYSIGRDQR